MSIDKLSKIKTDVQRLIDSYDNKGLYGPIAYLENVTDDLDRAIEELELEEADCSPDESD